MKYKRRKISIEITVTGAPNNLPMSKLLYHHQATNISIEELKQIILSIEENYPLNKNLIK